jgi:hypothetical protein
MPLFDRYENRTAYQEGRFSSEADLKRYRKLMQEEEEEEDG